MPDFLCTTQVAFSIGEQADFGFRVSAVTPVAALAGYTAWAANLAASTPWKGLFYNNTQFLPGKVSQYDTATGGIIATQVGGSTYTGTALSGSLPPQIAICVTLRSALAGRSNTGRFYLPAPGTTQVDANGRLLPANVLAVVTALKAAFDAGISAGWDGIRIYSKKQHTAHVATVVDCGDVLDTMRTRRDKLIEQRQSKII